MIIDGILDEFVEILDNITDKFISTHKHELETLPAIKQT